jgi:hypothetical protein
MSMQTVLKIGIFVAGVAVGAAGIWLIQDQFVGHRFNHRLDKVNQQTQIPSPTQRYFALVVLPQQGGLAATTSQPIQVWIKTVDGQTKLVLEADKTDLVSAKWLGPDRLQICYSDAQISFFNNRFNDIKIRNGLPEIQSIEVILHRAASVSSCA